MSIDAGSPSSRPGRFDDPQGCPVCSGVPQHANVGGVFRVTTTGHTSDIRMLPYADTGPGPTEDLRQLEDVPHHQVDHGSHGPGCGEGQDPGREDRAGNAPADG